MLGWLVLTQSGYAFPQAHLDTARPRGGECWVNLEHGGREAPGGENTKPSSPTFVVRGRRRVHPQEIHLIFMNLHLESSQNGWQGSSHDGESLNCSEMGQVGI